MVEFLFYFYITVFKLFWDSTAFYYFFYFRLKAEIVLSSIDETPPRRKLKAESMERGEAFFFWVMRFTNRKAEAASVVVTKAKVITFLRVVSCSGLLGMFIRLP